MDLAARIDERIRPTVEDMGFDVVRIHLSGQQRLRLQVMIEPMGGGAVSVDHCADVSRAISALLDVEDPIKGAYTLEVSSPGIDRPLVRAIDFERFAGFEVKVEMTRLIDGRRKFEGRLVGIEDGLVRLVMDGEEVALPFADIQRAKLVLTDELLAAAQG